MMLKFLQAEAEKELQDNDLQTKLTAIIQKFNYKDDTYEFLTVLLCFMTIMNENHEHMFITANKVSTNIHL